MENVDNDVKFKVHTGYFQLIKEYPEMYSNLLLIKSKLAHRCPEDWKAACKERSERLDLLLDELKPERIKEEAESKCKELIIGVTHHLKCKELIYSRYCNKVLAEAQRLDFFFNNINKYS